MNINDVVERAFELYLSRPRKMKPVERETIVRKKRTKGDR